MVRFLFWRTQVLQNRIKDKYQRKSPSRTPSFKSIVLQSFENLLIEHIIYSAALAVIVGMIFFRFTGRDPSWIIIAVAFVPDIDLALEMFRYLFRYLFRTPFHYTIHHGDFHNVLFLILFSLLFAAVLRHFGIRFIDGFICSAVGIAAHLFEDALVLNPAYAFFWPVSSKIYGIGIMPETRNVLIANITVLLVGIILLAGAVLVRTLIDGKGWWSVFLRGGRSGRDYNVHEDHSS